jgi:hypothetical protein
MTNITSHSGFVRLLHTLVVLLLAGSLGGLSAWGQTPTPGIIFKPATAGKPGGDILDPNGDGYVSATPAGFTAAAGDLGTQSEIPYKYLPQRVTVEPNADLRVGPNNKFTDFADVPGGGNSVGFYVDGSQNYMFRFRLGGSAPNSKGYSIAIDTDNKFGFSGPNADPNAVAHNPGFEMEILLATNFGVRLYNIDGTISPSGSAPDGSLIELPYASYAQKAVAATANDGSLDVFYDFYIPLATIQTYFPAFTLNTPLRLVANTIIAPHSVTHYQNISDVAGVNDAAYPNPDNAFIDLITNATPTSGGTVPTTTGNNIPSRSMPPVVNSPILSGATSVSGTSAEVAGTVITVYVDGSALGTTTTVQANGTWTLTGITPLVTGALVKATATATGKSMSDFSNEVQVGPTPACATAAPSISCASNSGVFGTATPGATVYLRYPDGTLVPASPNTNKSLELNPVIANTAGQFFFTTKGGNTGSCNNGQQGDLLGTFFVSQMAVGTSCESPAASVCINLITTPPTATPVVTTPNPITPSTTSIAGTAVSGSAVTLFVDGSRYSSVTATGGNFIFTGASLPILTSGRILTIYATANGVSCISAPVTRNVVAPRTVVPPVVSSPLYTGGTTVSGTSVEAPGSTITLTTYAASNGTGTPTGTYTATVQPNGSWSVTVPALAANSSVKATVTPTDYQTSSFSNVVAVLTRTSSVPVITGTYTERGTSVSGTSAAPVGSIITVYEDGYPLIDPITGAILTTTVQSDGGWTLSGLSASPTAPALYAGGVLTATATAAGQAESAFSNAVTVGCATLASNALAPAAVCQNNSATFTVANAEQGIIYTLQDAGSTAVGTSKVGTGTSITITTPVYTTAGTYPLTLNTFSIGAVNCQQSSPAANLTVNPLPLTRTVSAQNATLSTNQAARTGTNIIVQSSETGISYQLINTSNSPNTTVGAPQNGTGADLNLPTGPVNTTATSTSYAVRGTNSTTGCIRNVGTQTITYSGPLPVELTEFVVSAVDADAVLTWRTALEKNNARFEVERSATGLGFMRVGEVAGQGNSSQPHAYTFRDAAAARFGTTVYYRLRQVDHDGTAAYSPVRVVTFGQTKPEARVLLYPNPASASVVCSLALLPAGSYTVTVLSLTGQQLLASEAQGGQEVELGIASLPVGVYLVRIQGAALSVTQRLVKL